MDDLEVVKRCAVAMGYRCVRAGSDRGPGKEPLTTVWVSDDPDADFGIFSPLKGFYADAVVMAMVRKFHLFVQPVWGHPTEDTSVFDCWMVHGDGDVTGIDENLNRAICKVVSQLAAPK